MPATTDTVRSLLADSGIELAQARAGEFVIDRFDNFSNQAAGRAFGCFTGACCTAPPLAEAC
ncbi:hypothetical protein [Amycolatopsis sp. lyj-108]|uniref:hypothetical protein n=1 Tax=Amycolatopsis sp. lyj-108 TaxID=2789286 RepID=UPI00397AFE99